jgi:hypothetical protein
VTTLYKENSMAEERERREALERLTREIRENPALFHSLIFTPEQALPQLDYLPRRMRASIMALAPEDVIAGVAGTVINPSGLVQFCGNTCDASCTSTCGSGSCDGTCGASSCTSTCGSISCGTTVAVITARFEEVSRLQQGTGVRRGFFRPSGGS